MPVPWSPERHRIYIENTAERALTLKQLFDLRTFLQRLCKTKQLKRRRDDTGAWRPEADQRPLNWHEVNLYDVTDEVIKPVIFFHDQQWRIPADTRPAPKVKFWHQVVASLTCRGAYPGSPASPCGRRTATLGRLEDQPEGYSWAELVNTTPQRPQLMVSHWWGGRFSDFVTAIDKMGDDRGLSMSSTIWVCTFANNQFGENFGVGIKGTPFIKAIEFAEATILMVDRDAGSLKRSWCCLELHYTILLEKPLELYTSAGLVGSSAVSSGPLVDAISQWDVRESSASEAAYRRQILNFIAGVPEKSGLLTADTVANGRHDELLLIDGRPQLDESVDSQQEEQALLAKHHKTFEALNMDVRVSVIGRIGPPRRTKGCKLPNPCHRGISLGQLRTFARKAQTALGKKLPEVAWEQITVLQVCELFVKPETSSRQCSYAELVLDGQQVPDIYIDYQFSMHFADVMSSVEWFAEAAGLKDSALFFFTLLGINQRNCLQELAALKGLDDLSAGKLDVDRSQRECASLVMTAGHEVVDLETADVTKWSMSRAWRLYTLECAARLGQAVYVACPSGVMACTKLFPNGHSKFGSISRHITEAMCSVDIENSSCALDNDKRMILDFIRQGYGGRGVARLRRRLQRWAAFHLISELAAAGDKELPKLADMLSIPGLSITAELAKGILGQSALHEAVAAKSYSAVQQLLEDGFPPDATDEMHETPLHYAALAGDARMAQLLLDARADPAMESVFGETPLEVALEGPAAYLDCDSSAVRRLLEGIERD